MAILEVIKIKINYSEVRRGHQVHTSGSGAFKKGERRNRSRSAQKQNAIKSYSSSE